MSLASNSTSNPIPQEKIEKKKRIPLALDDFQILFSDAVDFQCTSIDLQPFKSTYNQHKRDETISKVAVTNHQNSSEKSKYHYTDPSTQSLSFIHAMGSKNYSCLSSSG